MKREIIVLVLCVVMFSVLFPIGHAAFDVNQTALPDLIVTDFWQEGDYIYYQVMNVGNELASGVHVDALFVNDYKTAENNIDKSLTPGERYTGMFPFSGDEAPVYNIMVQTDLYNSIVESNETNNSLTRIRKADSTPPVFLSEPIVDGLTETSAVISWVTDEYSDSRVEYGKASGIYDLTATDSELVTLHSVTLSELDAYTTYHFVVESADAGGNAAQSGENTFQTMAVPDSIIPTLSMESIPSEVQGKVNIQPAVSDDVGIEKVEFSIDGAPVFTAYSPPYILPLDTSTYMNGPHTLEARVFDLVGNSESDQKTVDIANVQDNSAPIVVITHPKDGDLVGGKVYVDVTITDDVGLNSARFYVNGSYQDYQPLYGTKSFTFYFEYYVGNVEEGAKLTFAVMAWDTSPIANVGSDNVRVYVHNVEPEPEPRPDLRVAQHTVEMSNNFFIIRLEIENVGNRDAKFVRILDGMKGFQPISAPALTQSSDADYFARYDPGGRWACMCIQSKVDIPAGTSHTYTYTAVPVLHSPPLPFHTKPEIGFFIDMLYSEGYLYREISAYFALPVGQTVDGKSISKAHEEAVNACNYLIVTDPGRMFTEFSPSYSSESIFNPSKSTIEVNTLLSTMAQLALYKIGVLGYFGASSIQTLKNLIKPGGDWAQKMSPDFSKVCGGYLLIVGETEIVPAANTFGWNIKWDDGGVTNDVCYSDQYYADLTGNFNCPELNVGRIIGNFPSNMTNVIQTSLGVYLHTSGYSNDFSHAALLSGTGPGEDDKVNCVNSVESTLQKMGLSAWAVHEKDYGVNTLVWFMTHAIGADFVYMAAHGTPDSCGAVNTGSLPLIDFMGSNPIVFATSCSTGDYEAGDDYNLAEAFLNRGAAVYIGSTQVSPASVNNIAANTLLQSGYSYPDDWMKSFTSMERAFSSSDKTHRFWIVEYNVYGDPKFAMTFSSAISELSMMSTQSSLQDTPLSSIDVNVPDYVNTTVGSLDYVQIPGGTLLLDVGYPRVPIYYTIVDYPRRVEVQDVVLGQRSGLTTGSGFNLPVTSMEFDSLSSGASVYSEADDGWYPEMDYEWKVLENPDGTTTLVIWMYPFYYNALTTDFRFYKNYHFDISYTVSPVEITDLSTDRTVYRQGDPLKIDMTLTNTGSSQDVIVSTILKRSEGGHDEFVNGLPLRTLKEFKTPAASFSEECDTTGFAPGYYIAEVTLKGTNGELLDKKTQIFKLGVSSIEIKEFTATPKYFGLEDDVQTRMTLGNNGTVDISGTAVTRIVGSTGQLIQEFKNAIVDLSPCADITITNVWDTSGVAEGSYSVIGYVLYNDELSDVQVTTVETDYVPPSLIIETPSEGSALQDGVTFTVSAQDLSGVASVQFSIQCAQGNIISTEFQQMPATLGADGKWHLYFDTRRLPDGLYRFVANGTDVLGNWGTTAVEFSIRNWATMELLPASETNKAGRTMPVKFSLRVAAAVDPAQPFIRNEELTIKIYAKGDPGNILQESTYGTTARDYRIDPVGELYITNFQTLKTRKTYRVEIYRKGMLIGHFDFSTVK